MTKEEYVNMIHECDINTDVVNAIQNQYGAILPEIVQRIISCAKESVFLDSIRILSVSEITDAETDLHVSFIDNQIIPLADCGDNDFLVFNFVDQTWSLFNIVDEIAFGKKNSIYDYIK